MAVKQPATQPVSGTQLLTLSLFIMLLAFFIVLTAVSDIDENKTRQTIESIERTFATDFRPGGTGPSQDTKIDSLGSGEGHAFDQLDELFQAELPSFTSKTMENSSVMYVRVRKDELFKALNLDNPENSGDFIQKLRAITAPGRGKMHYEINLLIGLGDNPAHAALKSRARIEDAVDQAGRYGQKLIAAGLPPWLVSVGLERGRAGFADLYFMPYEGPIPDNTKLPAKEEALEIIESITP